MHVSLEDVSVLLEVETPNDSPFNPPASASQVENEESERRRGAKTRERAKRERECKRVAPAQSLSTTTDAVESGKLKRFLQSVLRKVGGGEKRLGFLGVLGVN